MKKTATPRGVVGWRGKPKKAAPTETAPVGHESARTSYCVWCRSKRFFMRDECLTCHKRT